MLPSLKSAPVAQKKVLVRADFNVPFQDGKILDLTRLERVLPTLKYLIAQKAKVILMAHIGRPKGTRSDDTSTRQLVDSLSQLLDQPVQFVEDCVGAKAEQAAASLKPADILMLENLRYYPHEEADDESFAQKLAKLADIYVNDGFSVSHRAHASVHAITKFLPSYAGFLFEEEVNALQAALGEPKRPLLAIVGGAKVSTKLQILENLVERVNCLALGGGIANTFLKVQGYEIGSSLYEEDMVDTAARILEKSQKHECSIILPLDVVVAKELRANEPSFIRSLDEMQPEYKIFDIGPRTISVIQHKIKAAKTLVWNGPFGVFEIPPFDAGTRAAIKTAVEQTKKGELYSIAGGGETVAAITMGGGADGFSYLSTAGGAFLEWLEGRQLPGVEALKAA